MDERESENYIPIGINAGGKISPVSPALVDLIIFNNGNKEFVLLCFNIPNNISPSHCGETLTILWSVFTVNAFWMPCWFEADTFPSHILVGISN